MGLLRATVRSERDWWQIRLLDLNVCADGSTESEMLRNLEHSLTVEYHVALEHGYTPFVNLLQECPKEVCESWQRDDKSLRHLKLAPEVRQALSAVFRFERIAEFQVSQEPLVA